jgi:CheY-like chemotaxis protein
MAILIVEDDQFYSQLIAEFLEDRGLATVRLRSAEEAVAVDAAKYEGAIVDVMLPNSPEASGITMEESRGGFCTGLAVARRLLRQNASLRVVLLSSGLVGGEADTWAAQQSIPFLRKEDGREALLRALGALGLLGRDRTPLAFIVHGHDEAALLELKNYIQNALKWQEPVVLREQSSAGRTIIEKFEDYGQRIDCVFVLLTPDDKAISGRSDNEKRRSRQNVVFEAGFFYGALGRRSGRILLLHKGAVELPSDISGIIWIDITNGVMAAGEQIRKEVEDLWPGGSN